VSADADRIAQLEAELAEARETIAHCDKLGALREERLRDERAAHERTKVERDQWEHEAKSNAAKLVGEMKQRAMITEMRHCTDRLNTDVKREREGFTRRRRDKNAQWRELAAERDAAQADLARAKADLADTRAQLAKVRHDLDEMIRVHDEVEKDRDRVQAEAAAMREEVEPAFDEYIGRGEEPVSLEKAFAVFRDVNAGRALAARVPLLETVAKTARAFRQYTIEGKKLNAHGRIACIDTAPEALDDALAALDSKDGK
jgi:chromosome segregation ATPase